MSRVCISDICVCEYGTHQRWYVCYKCMHTMTMHVPTCSHVLLPPRQFGREPSPAPNSVSCRLPLRHVQKSGAFDLTGAARQRPQRTGALLCRAAPRRATSRGAAPRRAAPRRAVPCCAVPRRASLLATEAYRFEQPAEAWAPSRTSMTT